MKEKSSPNPNQTRPSWQPDPAQPDRVEMHPLDHPKALNPGDLNLRKRSPWMRNRIDEGQYFNPSNQPEYTYPTWYFDGQIYEDLCDYLNHHHEVDSADVDISVRNGIVTLRGTVEDRATKRFIENLADNCEGVRDVINQLTLRESNPYPIQDRDVPRDRT